MIRKIFAFILMGALLVLSACNDDTPVEVPAAQPPGAVDATANLSDAEDEPAPDAEWRLTGRSTSPMSDPDSEYYIPDDFLPVLDGTIFETLRENPMVLLQLQPVTPGEELMILHTSMGDITLRLFPDEAPIAVDNFTTHARNGFYDGVTFHRVIPGFMIQGGCPLGTGTGGQSIWGHDFGLEPSLNLRHFRGALAMAHAGGRMGSQFYIVQSTSVDPSTRATFEMMQELLDTPLGRFADGQRLYAWDIHSVEEFEYFIENGGTPFLDWHMNDNAHTVFGHVVEGMDVVDAIANVSRGANDRPDEPVIIERISFFYYGG
ncbi:MAG: peptidylprolyl isomerase [Defluviitaleaceae bacterium]|nr:peptidylprolyl isomerase [Defluviitaleaceae bacterium]